MKKKSSSLDLLKYSKKEKFIDCFPDTFNVLKYDLNFFSNASFFYRIDNTDYLIVIKSQ
jgi:hypothetical protein